jgi:hypothetical protein
VLKIVYTCQGYRNERKGNIRKEIGDKILFDGDDGNLYVINKDCVISKEEISE